MKDAFAALPLGIALGLVVGKPIGIVGAALLMRALGWARFPAGMDLRAMLGLGALCGIGFTMSLFIASLAYHDRLLLRRSRARHLRRLAGVGDRWATSGCARCCRRVPR